MGQPENIYLIYDNRPGWLKPRPHKFYVPHHRPLRTSSWSSGPPGFPPDYKIEPDRHIFVGGPVDRSVPFIGNDYTTCPLAKYYRMDETYSYREGVVKNGCDRKFNISSFRTARSAAAGIYHFLIWSGFLGLFLSVLFVRIWGRYWVGQRLFVLGDIRVQFWNKIDYRYKFCLLFYFSYNYLIIYFLPIFWKNSVIYFEANNL